MATGKKTMSRAEADKLDQKVMLDYMKRHKGQPQQPVPKNIIGNWTPGTKVKKTTAKKK